MSWCLENLQCDPLNFISSPEEYVIISMVLQKNGEIGIVFWLFHINKLSGTPA